MEVYIRFGRQEIGSFTIHIELERDLKLGKKADGSLPPTTAVFEVEILTELRVIFMLTSNLNFAFFGTKNGGGKMMMTL